MLCAKLLRHRSEERRQGKVALKAQEYFDLTIAEYDRLLIWVLDHQPLTMLIAVITLVVTVLLYIVIPKGFFPLQDTGFIQGITRAAPTVSFSAMSDRQAKLAGAILKDPDVESLSSFIGVDGTNTTLNSGRFLINLKPKGDRDGVETIMHRLDREAHDIAGISLYLQPVQDLTIDSTVSRSAYQFVVESARTADLRTWIPKLMNKLSALPQLENVSTNFLDDGLSAYIAVDRDTAARFGITAATIDNALYDAFGQRIITTIFTQSNQFRVILEADPAVQNSLASLGDIHLPAAGGGQVPLSAFARVEARPVPLEIEHLGQFPSALISFDITPGYSLGSAVDAVKAAEDDAGLPASITTEFQGAALAFQ
ncbi:MAG: efflux RND transporter permease subunit, partial [Stellaceae bacterium]